MLEFMRWGIVLAVFFLGISRNLQPFALDPEKANGLAEVMPLMWVLEPTMFTILKVLSAVGLVLFARGILPVLAVVPPLFSLIATGSLRNSKGDISHSTQVIAMCLVGVFLAYLVNGLARRQWRTAADSRAHHAGILAALLMLGASYVASGIVKLKASDGQWIARVPNLAVHMVKSNLSDYYSKPTGEISQVMTDEAPRFFSERQTLAKWVFGSGLILELGAFVLVLGRRWAFWWGGSLLAMHAGISLLMDIEFKNHMWLLFILCVVPGFRAALGGKEEVVG
jgi:hypothetical protein